MMELVVTARAIRRQIITTNKPSMQATKYEEKKEQNETQTALS